MIQLAYNDDVAAANPEVEMIGTCQMCPYMKKITLPKILKTLQDMAPEVTVDPELSKRAKGSIDRMLQISQ